MYNINSNEMIQNSFASASISNQILAFETNELLMHNGYGSGPIVISLNGVADCRVLQMSLPTQF